MSAIPYRQYANFESAAKEPTRKAPPLVSVIIPFLNEADVLAVCHLRVCEALSKLQQHCEVIYVDDGSNDNSWEING